MYLIKVFQDELSGVINEGAFLTIRVTIHTYKGSSAPQWVAMYFVLSPSIHFLLFHTRIITNCQEDTPYFLGYNAHTCPSKWLAKNWPRIIFAHLRLCYVF